MQGPSRESLAAAREALDALSRETLGARFGELSEQLFAVVDLLDSESALRRTLSDPAVPSDRRASLVDALLRARIGPLALDVVRATVRRRWSQPVDLVDALELLAIEAQLVVAESEGALDDVEDELFRFGRVVAANADLRAALTDRSFPAERKVAILRDLLADRVRPVSLTLLERAVTAARGRLLDDWLTELAELAAERRQRLLAVVRVAHPLDAGQLARLAAALRDVYGSEMQLQVEVDPAVLGGVLVRVGGEVIDGTVVHRLAEARRRIAG
jgi:F-type H+-transporting ATPase subunit delta